MKKSYYTSKIIVSILYKYLVVFFSAIKQFNTNLNNLTA